VSYIATDNALVIFIHWCSGIFVQFFDCRHLLFDSVGKILRWQTWFNFDE